jgi:hypothetical protein
MQTKRHNQKGYIAIITVVVISVVTLIIGLTVALSGINETVIGLENDQSHELLQALDGCVEEGYFRLKRDAGYTGGTIPYTSINCTLSISGGGVSRTIVATGIFGDLTRTVTVDVSLENNTGVTSEAVGIDTWEE